jgi:hypothetical protein
MEDPNRKTDVGMGASEPATENDVLRDLDVAVTDDVKGGGSRLTDIRDGTTNTTLPGEHTK